VELAIHSLRAVQRTTFCTQCVILCSLYSGSIRFTPAADQQCVPCTALAFLTAFDSIDKLHKMRINDSFTELLAQCGLFVFGATAPIGPGLPHSRDF
jgi:hypothetical protein